MSTENTNFKDLLSTGNSEQLQALRDAEIQKYQINKILLNILESAVNKEFDGITENLTRSFKILLIQDYIKLDNDEIVLGLQNLNIDLSYTEKKIVKNIILQEIKNRCVPIVKYVEEKNKLFPDVFEPKKKQMEIIALEEKQRQSTQELIKLKYKKLQMLKTILDFKSSSYVQNELKLMKSCYMLNKVKIQLLKYYISEELFCRSPYMVKAAKDILKFMDDELEKYK